MKSSDESSEEEDFSEKKDRDWMINISYEKNFWKKVMTPNLVYPPNICPYYHKIG